MQHRQELVQYTDADLVHMSMRSRRLYRFQENSPVRLYSVCIAFNPADSGGITGMVSMAMASELLSALCGY